MTKKILIITGILLVVLVIGGIVVGKNRGGTPLPAEPTPAIVDENHRVFKNNYLGFTYLAKYNLEEVATRDGRVLVNLRLTAPGSVILINWRGASQELAELSEVKMRRGNTLQYSEEVGIKGDNRGLLFRTADRKERTVFFKKGGRLLTVTLTAESTDPSWEAEFQELINSVEW